MSDAINLSELAEYLRGVCEAYSQTFHDLPRSQLSAHVSGTAQATFQNAHICSLTATDVDVDLEMIDKLCDGELKLDRLSIELRGWATKAAMDVKNAFCRELFDGTEESLKGALMELAPAFIALTRLAWLRAWLAAVDGEGAGEMLMDPPGFRLSSARFRTGGGGYAPDGLIDEVRVIGGNRLQMEKTNTIMIELKGVKSMRAVAQKIFTQVQEGNALHHEVWYSNLPTAPTMSPTTTSVKSSSRLWIHQEGCTLLSGRKATSALALLLQSTDYAITRKSLQVDGYSSCVLTDLHSTWLELGAEQATSATAAEPQESECILQIFIHRVQPLAPEGYIDLFASFFRLTDISLNRSIHANDAALGISWGLHPPPPPRYDTNCWAQPVGNHLQTSEYGSPQITNLGFSQRIYCASETFVVRCQW
ncbi:hypothetical protein H1R20_g3103, partial [Candolleomyces eurysporus]